MLKIQKKHQQKRKFQSDYTVRDISQILKVTIAKVRELINNGSLKHYMVSERGTRITQSQLDEFRRV